MLGLRTAIYQVADIDKAKEWYANAFEVQPYFDEPFYVGFSVGGFELGLQPEENPTADKRESVVAYWGVEDVEKEHARLGALGAVSVEDPNDVGSGIVVSKLKDEWGNIIGLIYNPHFGKTDSGTM